MAMIQRNLILLTVLTGLSVGHPLRGQQDGQYTQFMFNGCIYTRLCRSEGGPASRCSIASSGSDWKASGSATDQLSTHRSSSNASDWGSTCTDLHRHYPQRDRRNGLQLSHSLGQGYLASD